MLTQRAAADADETPRTAVQPREEQLHREAFNGSLAQRRPENSCECGEAHALRVQLHADIR